MLVAAYMEKHPGSPQTIKQHLAAIKMLFDYLVISQREPDSPLFPAAIGNTGKSECAYAIPDPRRDSEAANTASRLR